MFWIKLLHWWNLGNSSLLAASLIACLLLMNNYLRKNYVPMQLFESAVWVLISILIKNILFQTICIRDKCTKITKPMAFGEQILTSDYVSNKITTLMEFGEQLLTSDLVLNKKRLYLDLFWKELHKNYVTDAFQEQNDFSFFVSFWIK